MEETKRESKEMLREANVAANAAAATTALNDASQINVSKLERFRYSKVKVRMCMCMCMCVLVNSSKSSPASRGWGGRKESEKRSTSFCLGWMAFGSLLYVWKRDRSVPRL